MENEELQPEMSETELLKAALAEARNLIHEGGLKSRMPDFRVRCKAFVLSIDAIFEDENVSRD